MFPNTNDDEEEGYQTYSSKGGEGLIGPSYKAHHPAQPISISSLCTGLGLGLQGLILHVSLLLFSQDRYSSGRIRVLRKVRVVPEFLHVPNSHVHDVIWGKPPHDELPCRWSDAGYARLARRVEGDAFAANAPQFGICVFCKVNSLLHSRIPNKNKKSPPVK